MEHLKQEQIDKLTYYYLNNKILSDDLAQVKRHMTECDLCYEQFCVSIVAAYELGLKGLFDIGLLADEAGEEKRNVLVRISSIAGKLKLQVNDALESAAAKLWNFSPVPQLAAARGESRNDEQVFVSPVSEYSSVTLEGKRLTVRLDEDYFEDGKYEAVYVEGQKEQIIPFTRNEMEECLEAVLEVRNEKYELLIRESAACLEEGKTIN